MSPLHLLRQPILTLCLILFAGAACAQTAPAFTPSVGQEGKDVVWVPTPQALVDKMIALARVTASDILIDLGSGDGRTVITAAKRGARATGIEYNPDMVELSKRNAEQAGMTGKANFMKADLFETDLAQATVITMFLLPDINLKLRPKLLELKPGTRIVSNTFTMGEWVSDDSVTADGTEGCSFYCKAYLWIVPVKAEGIWKMAQGELDLKQSFQMLAGTLKSGGKALTLANGRIRGDQIVFTAGGIEYSGKVDGNQMSGTTKAGGANTWSATRSAAPAK